MASDAAAAVAEVDGSSFTVQWHDLELELPRQLPPTALFDIVEYETDEDALTMFRLLRSILGRDQFKAVRDVVGDDAENVGELFTLIFEEYGADPGESSASSTSS